MHLFNEFNIPIQTFHHPNGALSPLCNNTYLKYDFGHAIESTTLEFDLDPAVTCADNHASIWPHHRLLSPPDLNHCQAFWYIRESGS
jgi:hypothetical protein